MGFRRGSASASFRWGNSKAELVIYGKQFVKSVQAVGEMLLRKDDQGPVKFWNVWIEEVKPLD